MKLSTERILTTHVGSLPRPDDVWAMLQAKDKDELADQRAFDACMTAAVKNVIKTQAELGVDVVSDGEMSKIGYGTYIKDRLTGFSGDSPRLPPRDLAMYPRYMKKIAAAGETPVIRRQLCTGPVAIRDRKPLEKDLANMQAAVAAGRPVDAFMNAASPGVIALFQPNRYYPSHAAYLAALANVIARGVRGDRRGGREPAAVAFVTKPCSRTRAKGEARVAEGVDAYFAATASLLSASAQAVATCRLGSSVLPGIVAQPPLPM